MDTQDRSHTIAGKSRTVQQGFVRLINGFKNRASDAMAVKAVIDAMERFILWTGNLGALQDPKSKLSLDHRLLGAPEIRNQIYQQLDHMLEAIHDLTLISRGERIAPDVAIGMDMDMDMVDGLIEFDSSNEEPLDELQLSLDLLSEAIKFLFKIGVLVRKTAPENRFQRALQSSRTTFPDNFDIDYVKEKHPKLKLREHSSLAERLGRAIAQRRKFIKYCRDHKTRLAVDEENTNEKETEAATTLLQSSKATTLNLEKLQSILVEEDEDDAVSFFSASTTTYNLSTLKLPRLADLSKDGEPFECPICFTLQSMKQENTWRIHAFCDLKPYSCTIGGAGCDSELFADRNSWFEHELNNHRSQYACSLCNHELFSAPAHLRSHILKMHGQFSQNQLQSLESAGRKYPTDIKAQSCPFCNDWSVTLREKRESAGQAKEGKDIVVDAGRFRKHLATHLEQLAIFAIPRATEDEDDGQVNSSHSSVSTVHFKSEPTVEDNEELNQKYEPRYISNGIYCTEESLPNNTSAAGYYTEEGSNDVIPNGVMSPKSNHEVLRLLEENYRQIQAALFDQRPSYLKDENVRGSGLERKAKMIKEYEDIVNHQRKELKTRLEVVMKRLDRHFEAEQAAQQNFQEKEINDENLRGRDLEKDAKKRMELEDFLDETKEAKAHLEAAIKKYERRNEAKQAAQQKFQEKETRQHIDALTQNEDETSVTAQAQPEAAMERPSLNEDHPGRLKTSRGQY